MPKGANSAKPKSILAHYSSSEEEDEDNDTVIADKKIKEPDKGGGIKSSNSALPPGNYSQTCLKRPLKRRQKKGFSRLIIT